MTFPDLQDVRALFKKQFQQTPAHVAHAPGRIELLGGHTEAHDGLVLSVAADRFVCVACSPRTDGRIELVLPGSPNREAFWVTELQKNPDASGRVKGVLAQLRQHGVNFSGFNAVVHSTIPSGTMSDWAALEVATALAVRKLYPFTLSDHGATTPPSRDERGEVPPPSAPECRALARLCHAVETEFIGARGGVSAPLTSLLGKAWHVLEIDGRSLAVERLPMTGEVLVVCDPGASVPTADDEVLAVLESAARKLGARSLRTVEAKQLESNKAKLTEREHECARHVVSEIARTVAAERALRGDDHRQFGEYLFQSHESARGLLKVSSPELDLLVEVARAHPGCLGARLAGGVTINLVAHHQAQNFREHMVREYARRANVRLTPMVCQVVDGAA